MKTDLQQRVEELDRRLKNGEISRRDFLRYAALLSMTFGVNAFLAACSLPGTVPLRNPGMARAR